MTLDEKQIQSNYKPPVKINKVEITRPLVWMSKGISDLKKAKFSSLVYGFTFALIGLVLFFVASKNPIWSTALTTAFLLLGPFLAIGLYDLSRQIEEDKKPSLKNSIQRIRDNLVGLGFFAVLLGIILMIWLRISALTAGIFFNDIELVTKGWSVFLDGRRSIEFLVFFTIFGFFIAQLVFSISVVSIPMLLHRKIDVITAITTSLRVVIKNPLAMLVWAILIVLMINLGIIVAFVGLSVTLPIIGHASWHAYRELVGESPT